MRTMTLPVFLPCGQDLVTADIYDESGTAMGMAVPPGGNDT